MDEIFDGKQIKITDMSTKKKRLTGYISKDLIFHTWRKYPQHFFRKFGGYAFAISIIEDLDQKNVRWIYLDEKSLDKKTNKWVKSRTLIVKPENVKTRAVPYRNRRFEPQFVLAINQFDKIIRVQAEEEIEEYLKKEFEDEGF